jgi:hypothetical protein
MGTRHEVEKGESILSIAQEYGLLPDSIWNDPANDELRKKRKFADRLSAGDIVFIRDKKTKEESGSTEQRHRFKKKGGLGVMIRLDVDPNDASTHDDRFILESTDGTYRVEKTIQDDLVPGDKYLDLHYSGLHRDKSYRLEVVASGDSAPEIIFENVSYQELANLSPRAEGGDWEEGEPSNSEDVSYPEEPDQDENPSY